MGMNNTKIIHETQFLSHKKWQKFIAQRFSIEQTFKPKKRISQILHSKCSNQSKEMNVDMKMGASNMKR